MDFTEKLVIWEKQRAGLLARRVDIMARLEALEAERKALEADEALLVPLEKVLEEELIVAKETK